MVSAKTLLKDVFGFSEFRPGQRQIIDAVASGENVLAIMPTGGGKSLCFQLPALLNDGSAALPCLGIRAALSVVYMCHGLLKEKMEAQPYRGAGVVLQ